MSEFVGLSLAQQLKRIELCHNKCQYVVISDDTLFLIRFASDPEDRDIRNQRSIIISSGGNICTTTAGIAVFFAGSESSRRGIKVLLVTGK